MDRLAFAFCWGMECPPFWIEEAETKRAGRSSPPGQQARRRQALHGERQELSRLLVHGEPLAGIDHPAGNPRQGVNHGEDGEAATLLGRGDRSLVRLRATPI